MFISKKLEQKVSQFCRILNSILFNNSAITSCYFVNSFFMDNGKVYLFYYILRDMKELTIFIRAGNLSKVTEILKKNNVGGLAFYEVNARGRTKIK